MMRAQTSRAWRALTSHPAPRAVALALLVALLALLAVLGLLDWSGFVGPGGAAMVADSTGGVSSSILVLMGAAQGFPLQAGARALMVAANLLAVLGASLAAWRLGGRTAAVAAGVVAGLWSQLLLAAPMIGPTNLAMGLAWLAVGLAFVASRHGRGGLALMFVAGGLGLLSAYEYSGVAPALAYLALPPLLCARGLRWRGLQLAGLGLGAASLHGLLWLRGAQPPLADLWTGSPPDLAVGLELALRMGRAEVGYDGAVGALLVGGLIAAVIPGREGLRGRLPLALLTGLVVVLVCAMLGPRGVRPRYLMPAMLGAVLLLSVGLGNLAELARRLGPLRWLPLLLVGVLLGLDAAAYGHRFATLRAEREGTAPPALPPPPAPFLARYQGMRYDFSVSATGAADLHRFGLEAPPGGVIGVFLRDAREAVLVVGALEADAPVALYDARLLRDMAPDLPPGPQPYRPILDLLTYRSTGRGAVAPPDRMVLASAAPTPGSLDPWRELAAQLLGRMDQQGALLVLPALDSGETFRVQPTELELILALRERAQELGRLERPSPWWETFQGQAPIPR